MKINKIKINGFGKLENKEIELTNKINIVYGENETGKTTILKFINCILYGISKNKNGKEISDYDKYKPWEANTFSGKLQYELNNGEKYEVFRDFTKKNPQIYNENSEDISKEFDIDKNKGNQFFYEQTKITEEIFVNTIMAEQKEVVLSSQEQNILIQKLTNLASAGDENVSYKKIVDKLNKKLLEEVGTTRTTERPINIVEEKIKTLNKEKENLKINKVKIEEAEESKNSLLRQIEILEKELRILKSSKKEKELEEIEHEKIKINENIIKEYEEKIIILENKLNKKNHNKKSIFFKLVLLALVAIVTNILLKNIYFKIIIDAAILGICLIAYLKNEKIKNKNISIRNEIKIIEQNIKEQKEKIEIISNKILNTEKTNEEFNEEIELKEKEINNKKISLNVIEIEKDKILEEIEDLSKVEEELEYCKEQKEELFKLSNAIILAKETLEDAYKKAKNTITPKFTENLSKTVKQITNGKYENVNINDENGLVVELENGNYINCNKLSIGTIEQMYLALRLSTVEEISEETMPIILDEPFAYSDDERIKNIFKYIQANFQNNQIIVFTCSDREKRILEQENIDYNYIEL